MLDEIKERGKVTSAEKKIFTHLKYASKLEEVEEKKLNAWRIKQEEELVIEKNRKITEQKIKAGQDHYKERLDMADIGLRSRYESMRELESVEMRQIQMLNTTQAHK